MFFQDILSPSEIAHWITLGSALQGNKIISVFYEYTCWKPSTLRTVLRIYNYLSFFFCRQSAWMNSRQRKEAWKRNFQVRSAQPFLKRCYGLNHWPCFAGSLGTNTFSYLILWAAPQKETCPLRQCAQQCIFFMLPLRYFMHSWKGKLPVTEKQVFFSTRLYNWRAQNGVCHRCVVYLAESTAAPWTGSPWHPVSRRRRADSLHRLLLLVPLILLAL